MKPLLTLLLTFTLFTGCTKFNSGECNNGDESVVGIKGSWELRFRTGGMSPDANYPPGNGNILRFSDSTYVRYWNGQITSQGMYTISQGINPETGQTMKRINYPSGSLEYYEITGNQMTLYSGIRAADGTISMYARQ